MIDVNQGYIIAKKLSCGFELLSTRENDSSWLYTFGTLNSDGLLYPGAPTIIVSKKDGNADLISIPPFNNIEILSSAKLVTFDE